MAKVKLPETRIDDSSLPYRVVIDFLEGTLRKQDAIAFARGFIEHHFDSQSDSGYYVMPYEGGYIFEAHEGGSHRAYLPNVLRAIQDDPSSSACIQMARRILEVKRAASGTYTSILLPEGAESQNPAKSFPEPGPSLIPFQRSGMVALMAGLSVFSIGFVALLLATVVYLVQVSGLMKPDMAKLDVKSMPLLQWPTMTSVTTNSAQDKYVKTVKYENGQWHWDTDNRRDIVPSDMPDASSLPAAPANNPLAPPGLSSLMPGAGAVPPKPAGTLSGGPSPLPSGSPPGTSR